MDFAIVDIEDTGFAAPHEPPVPQEIIELAALRVRDWRVVNAMYRRVRPTLLVLSGAMKVNGYAPEAWAGCRKLDAGDMLTFHDFVSGAQWVGSNPGYDYGHLEAAARKFAVPDFPLGTHRKIDVGSLGAPLVAVRQTRGGLDGICEALAAVGHPVPPMPRELAEIARGRDGAHTAMGDAWRTLHALRCLWEPAEAHWRAKGAEQ